MMLVRRYYPLPFERRGCPIEDPEQDQPNCSPSHNEIERRRYISEILDSSGMYGHQTGLDTDCDGVSSLNSGL